MSLTFWKPGTAAPGSTLDRASQLEESIGVQIPPTHGRGQLPILKYRDNLLYCVEKFGVVIVIGQTGCGKTTQLPQFLLQAGWADDGHTIACTQPRRIAATSVASRVSDELGTKLGEEVGYSIRFEDVSSKEKTRILYMTDGMLFRETLVDPLLSRSMKLMSVVFTPTSCLESLESEKQGTSRLFWVLNGSRIRKKRPSLRLIVSSATLDATKFLDYFSQDSEGDATIVSLEGRMYPVEVTYLQEPTPDYVRKAAETAWNINLQSLQQGPGDILVFLTGREEIDRCVQELSEMIPSLPARATRIVLLPLHAGLSTEEQVHVFQPAERGTRKVVISTNIAEITSCLGILLTGRQIRIFNPTTLLASLATVPTSVASATQRAGRAGRTSPGICYRLYTSSVFKVLPATTSPEITRTDMTTPILQLKSLGIDDLMKFDWVSAPPAETVLRALEGLYAAGMIDDSGRLTSVGEQVAECPVEVGIARMLFSSKEFKCGEEILTIAAMTAVQDIFVIPEGAAGALAELERRKFTAEEGVTVLIITTPAAYNAFTRYGRSSSWCKSHALSFRAMSRAVSIRSQLKKYMQRFNLPLESCEGDSKRLTKCLVSGYWRNGARWTADGTYRSVRGNMILHVHPTSVLFTRKPRSGWVIFHEVEETKKAQ
ncbi:P-loop containing nucleoside triphosphate hydrolase protein [Agrocybe pediades]|nr:P-loop containing nucleoside triphosphate hydrolase protein [Agrocybe pediades]